MIDLSKWTEVTYWDRLERIPADFSEPQEMSGYIPENDGKELHDQDGDIF